MKTLILLPLAFILTVGPTRPVEFPWTTFSGDMAQAGQGNPRIIPCPQGEVFVLKFKHKNTMYIMAAAVESGAIVFVYDPDPDNRQAPPTEIGFGQVDMETPGKNDVIPPLRWEPFDPDKHGNPCILLFPESA